MPADSGYVMDAATVQRIARAVRDFERGVTKPGLSGESSEQLLDGEAYIQITSARATAGEYNGIEKVIRPDTGGWQYAQTACVARELNGASLTVGNTYKGTLKTGINDSGTIKPVFAVQASGGGGDSSTPLSTALIITSKDPDTAFYNASACSHDGAAWQCGAAGNLPIDLLAIDMNGLELDIGRRYAGVHVGTKDGRKIYGIQTWWNVVTNVWCDDTGLHQTKREI